MLLSLHMSTHNFTRAYLLAQTALYLLTAALIISANVPK